MSSKTFVHTILLFNPLGAERNKTPRSRLSTLNLVSVGSVLLCRDCMASRKENVITCSYQYRSNGGLYLNFVPVNILDIFLIRCLLVLDISVAHFDVEGAKNACSASLTPNFILSFTY